jgi:hypothetical protein
LLRFNGLKMTLVQAFMELNMEVPQPLVLESGSRDIY